MNHIGIAADHAGFILKAQLIAALDRSGYRVTDFGARHLTPGDDYPDFVEHLARAVASGQVDRGVAICGTGVGACVTANKVPGVRAGVCCDHYTVHQAVEDVHMNVLCIGARVTGLPLAWELTRAFLTSRYSDAQRHQRRLGKLAGLESGRQVSAIQTAVPKDESVRLHASSDTAAGLDQPDRSGQVQQER